MVSWQGKKEERSLPAMIWTCATLGLPFQGVAGVERGQQVQQDTFAQDDNDHGLHMGLMQDGSLLPCGFVYYCPGSRLSRLLPVILLYEELTQSSAGLQKAKSVTKIGRASCRERVS